MRSLGQSQERCLLRLLVIAAVIFATGEAMAQSSSIFERDLPQTGQAPIMLDGGSWTYIPPVLPRRINIHDRVTIRVDELASMTQEGDVQQRRTAQYNAVLKDWIGLIGLKAIKPNAQNDGDQTINGQLQQTYRAQGDIEARESLALNIACTVADIRPNGDLVLEGHKQIRINENAWEVSLSGICRHQDVGPDNVVLSRNIADLKVDKREHGQARDGYKRGWLTRLLDEFAPF
ncbi:MAG: flagellar basal body L-ring protein FlgH [Planctomycetaceae bacterium]|nr:flagellar basal body L-ring protein FlgH [Planctomycetales bacterium]MCB9873851.1 flagellar basal body L-ring protein FlgH [Planctomycetaceae bacterium]MCB9941459.1 flagellar basal body L-ring protein FlgH [Planctomycetaceae bacterium]